MNRQEQFIAEFNALPDWLERYRYLIELGETLPPMPELLKMPTNRVQGCSSMLYFFAAKVPVIRISASGNSPITLGLAALLAHLFNGLTASELAATPPVFHLSTGLLDNLTYTRREALLEMLRRLVNS